MLQDAEMCRQVVTRITDTIRSDLPRFLGVVHSLLHRPTVDKLTVLAAEILMLAHTHFSLPVEQVNRYPCAVSFQTINNQRNTRFSIFLQSGASYLVTIVFFRKLGHHPPPLPTPHTKTKTKTIGIQNSKTRACFSTF